MTSRPTRWAISGPRRYPRLASYFVTTAGVAELLGISRPRVIQLGDKGFLPYLVARNGWRLYRRHQVEVIANSRTARGRRRLSEDLVLVDRDLNLLVTSE
jgi:hypothetical protein